MRPHNAVPNEAGREIAAAGSDQRQQPGPELDACDGGRGVGERKAMTNILAIGLTFFLFLCGLAIGAVVGVYRAEHTAKISSAAKEFPRAYGIELKGEKE